MSVAAVGMEKLYEMFCDLTYTRRAFFIKNILGSRLRSSARVPLRQRPCQYTTKPRAHCEAACAYVSFAQVWDLSSRALLQSPGPKVLSMCEESTKVIRDCYSSFDSTSLTSGKRYLTVFQRVATISSTLSSSKYMYLVRIACAQ